MNDLKCPSCDGLLEKEGNVYVCQNCGETFNHNEVVDDQLYDVVLTTLSNKIKAIKTVREITGLVLADAKAYVDKAELNMPCTFKSAIPKADALRIVKMFSDSGNSAEIIISKFKINRSL